MDVHITTIRMDSIEVSLAHLQKGDTATAVSYADVFRKMDVPENNNTAALVSKFPAPAPIDEMYLKRKDIAQSEEKPLAKKQEKEVSIKRVVWTACITLASIILLIFLLPSLLFRYYLLRHHNAKVESKAFWAYRSACYYLHQIGIFRDTLTPMQYAKDKVDPMLNTNFVQFMNVYLKTKYAKQTLTTNEQQAVAQFLHPFLKTTRQTLPYKQRLFGFLNPLRTINFYVGEGE
jgi:hypothetical protein